MINPFERYKRNDLPAIRNKSYPVKSNGSRSTEPRTNQQKRIPQGSGKRKPPDPCLKCTKKIKLKETKDEATLCVNRGTRKDPIRKCVTIDKSSLSIVKAILEVLGEPIER